MDLRLPTHFFQGIRRARRITKKYSTDKQDIISLKLTYLVSSRNESLVTFPKIFSSYIHIMNNIKCRHHLIIYRHNLTICRHHLMYKHLPYKQHLLYQYPWCNHQLLSILAPLTNDFDTVVTIQHFCIMNKSCLSMIYFTHFSLTVIFFWKYYLSTLCILPRGVRPQHFEQFIKRSLDIH